MAGSLDPIPEDFPLTEGVFLSPFLRRRNESQLRLRGEDRVLVCRSVSSKLGCLSVLPPLPHRYGPNPEITVVVTYYISGRTLVLSVSSLRCGSRIRPLT